jgi:hypothetical protein
MNVVSIFLGVESCPTGETGGDVSILDADRELSSFGIGEGASDFR